jgi:CRISPR/Cas system-associated protein Cas7 (RAMP superfamily)
MLQTRYHPIILLMILIVALSSKHFVDSAQETEQSLSLAYTFRIHESGKKVKSKAIP